MVIKWWELRRIPYNLIVGAAGLITFAVAILAGLVVESTGNEAILPDPPIAIVLFAILYGIAANVMYSAGWLTELALQRFWPNESSRFGRMIFVAGLIGSIVLTVVPAVLVVLLSLIQACHRSFH